MIRTKRLPSAWPACAAALLALGLALPASAQEARAQRGQVFARTHCAKCHAIGKLDTSPLKEAPPFRALHTRYPVEDLAESLAEGIVTGHPSMPEFRLDPAQIQDLIAYLKSLER